MFEVLGYEFGLKEIFIAYIALIFLILVISLLIVVGHNNKLINKEIAKIKKDKEDEEELLVEEIKDYDRFIKHLRKGRKG